MMRANNLRIVEAATVPGAAIRPRVALNVTVGLLSGLFLGLALALLREQLDSSIKTPDDIEKKLGVTFLGLLPEVEENAAPSRSRRRSRHRDHGTETRG